MRLVTASNKSQQLKITKSEWEAIGKQAGWIRTATSESAGKSPCHFGFDFSASGRKLSQGDSKKIVSIIGIVREILEAAIGKEAQFIFFRSEDWSRVTATSTLLIPQDVFSRVSEEIDKKLNSTGFTKSFLTISKGDSIDIGAPEKPSEIKTWRADFKVEIWAVAAKADKSTAPASDVISGDLPAAPVNPTVSASTKK